MLQVSHAVSFRPAPFAMPELLCCGRLASPQQKVACTIGLSNSLTCIAETRKNAVQEQLNQLQQDLEAWRADGESKLTAQVAALQVG